MILPVLAALGLVAAAIYAWPAWRAYRLQPRETREMRRQRRFRMYIDASLETIHDGYARDAMHWIRKASRIQPDHAETLAALGHILYERGRYERSLLSCEAAIDHRTAVGQPSGWHADVALTGARAAAHLRNHCPDPLEKEVYAERVLSWARLIAYEDPELLDALTRTPAVRDLSPQITSMADVGLQEIGVGT